ncbi:hypothetical protein ACEQ8H_000854 [Pleosporales sp. CAS-2024a]
MSSVEKPASLMSYASLKTPKITTPNDAVISIVKEIMSKLQTDPGSITTEDARRLSENAVAGDLQTAKIISAVEALASTSVAIHQVDPLLGQAPHTSLPTIVNDLKAAVDQNPGDVTTQVLKDAQNVVSKMQKAVGHTHAPHPELEAQLQQEMAKMEPKVAQGTVTIDEANHLHSLEARAHGHTEKGGITAIAQSVAAKRERQLSCSSGPGSPGNASRADSKTASPQDKAKHSKKVDVCEMEEAVAPKMDSGTAVAKDDALEKGVQQLKV